MQSEKAEREREKDPKREAIENQNSFSRNPNEFFEYNRRKENEIELIDKAILCLGIIEMNNEMAPRTVVIDECIRLTKKFSNPESYKFINASLDKI